MLLLICTLSPRLARAQTDELAVQGQTGKLYLLHSVVARENWYSIGRLFNQSPKGISSFNNLSMDKPLEIGQQVEIPLTAANFSQTSQKAAGETLVPVYHIVQEKEWMYRISVDYNRVPIGSLEKWNHISKDQVKAGMRLVVGFLRVKTALSALAKTSTPVPAPVLVSTKTDTTKKTAVKAVPPVAGPTNIHEETKADPRELAKNFNGGYFKADFADAGKTAEGLAGIFKSNSGWQDGKYYALMNNLPVGTIVQVFLPATNKSIYAKVLGELPDMKENPALTIRISNAAAAELGAVAARFNVEIKY
jgi:LysM repeat protein